MPEPHLRAGDTDREAVAAALGSHMAAGRLTVAEYEERLAQAYAATTFGELEALTADLPTGAVRTAPAPADEEGMVCALPGARQVPAPVPRAAHGGRPEHSWRAWLGTSVTVLVVYLVISVTTWSFGYFWPIWVIGPWGAVLLARQISQGRSHPRDDGRAIGR